MTDIAMLIGPLFSREPDIPMYSFDLPSLSIWQGAFDWLVRDGWSEQDAVLWLQSRGARHACDEVDPMFTHLGELIARHARYGDIDK